jgi:hypothetical protein
MALTPLSTPVPVHIFGKLRDAAAQEHVVGVLIFSEKPTHMLLREAPVFLVEPVCAPAGLEVECTDQGSSDASKMTQRGIHHWQLPASTCPRGVCKLQQACSCPSCAICLQSGHCSILETAMNPSAKCIASACLLSCGFGLFEVSTLDTCA